MLSQNMDTRFAGRVIMVSKEEHVPYDRPILSKVSVWLLILQKVIIFGYRCCSILNKKYFTLKIVFHLFLTGLYRLHGNQRYHQQLLLAGSRSQNKSAFLISFVIIKSF